MIYPKAISLYRSILMIILLFTFASILGCSSDNVPLEERLRAEYIENGRLDRFNELYEQYDGSKAVLLGSVYTRFML